MLPAPEHYVVESTRMRNEGVFTKKRQIERLGSAPVGLIVEATSIFAGWQAALQACPPLQWTGGV